MWWLAVAALSGCASTSRVDPAAPLFAGAVAEPEMPASVQGGLENQPAGAQVAVEDGPWGPGAALLLGTRYPAASGRDCRRFAVLGPGGTQPGLACRRPDGTWLRVRVLHDQGRPLMERRP